jgi:ubiquinone/menaquinone biosynthesis C-methylase UbiE
MSRPATANRRQQEQVNAYFHSQSSYWKDIYSGGKVQGEIYRDRQAAVLAWLEELSPGPEARVLEIGCGAGMLAVTLALRGLCVHAIDSTEAMIEQARRHAEESGVIELLSLTVGDVCDLDFADASFDLVIAIGVIPWLAQPELAIREMARVIRQGGHVILTADNRSRLIYVFDPLMNPTLAALRKRVKNLLKRVKLIQLSPGATRETLHDSREIDKFLASAELVKTRGMTLGFGPFSFLGYKFIPERPGVRLHHWMQRLAERNVPILRNRGAQYLVMARKQAANLLVQSINEKECASGTANIP